MLKNANVFALWGLFIILMLSGCSSPQLQPRVLWPPPPSTPRLEWIGTFGSEADFKKTKMEQSMEALTGGQSLTKFKGPSGIASDGNGRIFISDAMEKGVKIYDLNSRMIDDLVKYGAFQRPGGIAMDSQGRLFIADGPSGQVLVFKTDGTPLFSISDKEYLEKPVYLAINEKLGRVYVSDVLGHRISVFGMDGAFMFSFGQKGNSEGEFFAPQGLAINKDDRIFVADMFNARIQVFSADGKFIKAFGERGDRVNEFETPKDLAFDSEGHLYVLDSRRPNFRIFSQEGELLLVVGDTVRTTHKIGFSMPIAIHIDNKDRIYIADHLNQRFTVWQYLNKEYLEKRPISESDIELIRQINRKR